MSYYVPETTCCNTTIGAPIMNLPPGASADPSMGSMGTMGEPPVIGEGRIGTPRIGEDRVPGGGSDRITPNPMPGVGEDRIPGGGGARFERPAPGFGTP